MNKAESRFQTAFSRWVQNRWEGGSAAFELKRSLGGSIPVSAIKDHQLIALKQVTENGLYHKLADGGFAQTPWDCFILKGSAYVVVAYGLKLRDFYMIPIHTIIDLKSRKVVSITEKVAGEIGRKYTLGE